MAVFIKSPGTASVGTPSPGNDSLTTRSFQKFTDHLCCIFLYIHSYPGLPFFWRKRGDLKGLQTGISSRFWNSNSDFFCWPREYSMKIMQFQAV